MAKIRLKSYEFRRERKNAWSRLERLVERAEQGGIGSLSGKELMTLPRLYRNALSSLNVARAISLDKNVLEYLEALCQRSYFAVYGVRRHLRETFVEFLTQSFPKAVRRFRRHLALATLVLTIGTLAGFLLVQADPDKFYAFVGADLAGARGPDSSTQSLRDGLFSGGPSGSGLTAFASMLFTHNAKVGMLCFALGFVAGIPVFILLLTNGLMLGAFWALFASRGLGVEFMGWVSPHGVTEFLAVLLCAAAGLVLGQNLVFPGRKSRLTSLALRGREAGVIVLGAIGMFLIAGLFEGFFRQMVTDTTVRYAVALSAAIFWGWYFVKVGRRPSPR